MPESPLSAKARALRERFRGSAHVYTAGEINNQLVKDLIEEADGTKPKRKLYRSGLRAIDRIVYGFEPGSLVLFVARPGVGKSVLAVNLADGFGSQGITVAVIWAEDGLDAFGRRSVSRRLRVKAELLREGNEESLSQLRDIQRDVVASQEWPIFVVAPRTRFSIEETCEAISAIQPNVVILDHLGEIKLHTKDLAQRHYVLGETVRTLRQHCRDIGAVPILMAQMNREIEKEKKPQYGSKLSHIFGSGEIEQAARVVGFCEKETPTDEFYEGPIKFTVDIKKNTNGKIGIARMMLHPEYMLLQDSF